MSNYQEYLICIDKHRLLRLSKSLWEIFMKSFQLLQSKTVVSYFSEFEFRFFESELFLTMIMWLIKQDLNDRRYVIGFPLFITKQYSGLKKNWAVRNVNFFKLRMYRVMGFGVTFSIIYSISFYLFCSFFHDLSMCIIIKSISWPKYVHNHKKHLIVDRTVAWFF